MDVLLFSSCGRSGGERTAAATTWRGERLAAHDQVRPACRARRSSAATKPMAIGPLTLGPKPPEVTTPSRSPERVGDLGAFARRRAPFGLMPTRRALGPSASSSLDALGAGEVALARGGACWIDQARPASTGWSSRRCRGRRGRARLPAAGSRARPGRWASPARRPAAARRQPRRRRRRRPRSRSRPRRYSRSGETMAVEAADAVRWRASMKASRPRHRRQLSPCTSRGRRALQREQRAVRRRRRASRRPAAARRCARSRRPCARR